MSPAYTDLGDARIKAPRRARSTSNEQSAPKRSYDEGVPKARPPRAYTQYRLEYDAARYSLREATSQSLTARAQQRHARAELSRIQAQHRLGKTQSHDVSRARTLANRAQDEARAAAAEVRARRAQVAAARSNMATNGRDPERSPYARLVRVHQEITVRWMEYETDPAKQIGFPNMSDGRHPLTAKYLEAQQRASWLQPDPNRKVRPEEFARYRDAVALLQHAFAVAEADARGKTAPQRPLSTSLRFDEWIERSQAAIDKSTDALGQASTVASGWYRQLADAMRGAWEQTKREWDEKPPPPPPRDEPR